jgi:hypothetical protein
MADNGGMMEGYDPLEAMMEAADQRRFCPDCGADIVGNDPHGGDCPEGLGETVPGLGSWLFNVAETLARGPRL